MNISRVDDWEQDVYDVSEINAIFSELKPKDFFHLILADQFGNSIQCKGEIQQLSLEIIQTDNDKTQKIVLGVSKEDRSETTIPYQDSELLVRKNEILMIEDALVCFEAFFQLRPIPNAFNQRLTSSS